MSSIGGWGRRGMSEVMFRHEVIKSRGLDVGTMNANSNRDARDHMLGSHTTADAKKI